VLPPFDGGLHCGYNVAGQPYWPLTVLPSFAGRLDCAARVQAPAELRAAWVPPPFYGALHCGDHDTQGVL
jgi:hypothetical protein